MLSSRGAQKFDRITVTFVPSADDRSFHRVPSTFSTSHRSYEWRKADTLSYMIVPRKVSSVRIEVDVFVNPGKKGRLQSKSLQKVVQQFVKGKMESEWKGLKLSSVGRPTHALPPRKSLVRGSIEDFLGVSLDR